MALAAACFLLGPAVAMPQTNPLQQTPGWKQVPQGTGACSVEKSCAELAPEMIRSAQGASPLEDNLRYLTDSIGGRVTGSLASRRAVSWAAGALRRAGVDAVHIEKFTIPAGWSEGQTSVEVLSPGPFPVRLVSIGWSPPTPAGGITADVVDAGTGDEAGFAQAGAAVKGAIVLIHTKPLGSWADLFAEYEEGPAIVARARKAGAAAIFWMSTRPNLLLYRHVSTVDGRIGKIPEAVVAREHAERMARLLVEGKKVRVHFEMPNRVSGPFESENVIGEIRGREKPDEFVLLGAHLDSWELGTGALDNGCNAAMVIDAARVIHASGTIPRRSVRFVLFNGEEQGVLGSWSYARTHRAELDRMDAAVIFDEGMGPVTGYSLGGRSDTLDAVREALAPVKPLGVKDFTLDAFAGTDNLDFLLEGVPTLVANQEEANYLLNYHAASDTFDKVDIGELKRHVAIAAITTFALADAGKRIGPRQSHAEVEKLMKDTGLDQQMKQMGFWPSWESGERTRQP